MSEEICDVCGRPFAIIVQQIDDSFCKIPTDNEMNCYSKTEIDENGKLKEIRYYGNFCPKCGKIIIDS